MESEADTQWNELRTRLLEAISDSEMTVQRTRDDVTALLRAGELTETLRQATISAGQIRAALAAQVRDARRLSLAGLAQLMGVGKQTAAGILRKRLTPK